MSQLKVNSIIPVSGVPAGATGGGIVQVVHTTKSDRLLQVAQVLLTSQILK